jgi:hypothetical protein
MPERGCRYLRNNSFTWFQNWTQDFTLEGGKHSPQTLMLKLCQKKQILVSWNQFLETISYTHNGYHHEVFTTAGSDRYSNCVIQ